MFFWFCFAVIKQVMCLVLRVQSGFDFPSFLVETFAKLQSEHNFLHLERYMTDFDSHRPK